MSKSDHKPTKPDIRAIWMHTFLEWQRVLQSLTENPRQGVTMQDDVHAFAACWFSEESKLLGIDLRKSTESKPLAKECFVRLNEWAFARAKWHLLLARKECPEQEHTDKQVADAAFAGLLASQQGAANDQRVGDFLKSAATYHKAAYDTFRKWIHEPQPERWAYPLLDSWLICIWPLVERHGWSNRDVWLAAIEKFDNVWLPLETARHMGDHCRHTLKLNAKSHGAGRPLNDNSSLPKLAELALRIPAELPDNSLFARKQ